MERLLTVDKDFKECNVKHSSYASDIRSSQAKSKEYVRRICDYNIASRKQLLPLGSSKPPITKITSGEFPKLQSFPRKKRTFIDRQRIFRDGGLS